MDEAIYPIIGKEKELPFYVFGVGCCDWQYHVIRENGYPLPQIAYCLREKGILIVDGNTYEITPNMSYFLPANIPHEYYSVGDVWENHWITFGGYAVDDTLAKFGLTKAAVFSLTNFSGLETAWNKIFTTLKQDRLFGGFIAAGLVFNFIIEYYKIINLKASNESLINSTIIIPLLLYIDNNLYKDITLKELADIISISEQHLCRLFKKQFNMRPFEYITRRRIQEAKSLLLRNKYKIKEIAKMVGFNDCSYFCAIFKKYEMISPTKFLLNRV